jgi:CRISPR system Cascade subunit CasE
MTLHLTRATLRTDAQTRALLPILLAAKTGSAHNLTWSIASDSPDRERDYLWRQGADGVIYILSEREITGGPLYDVAAVPVPTYSAGDLVRFDLRCSPVVRRSREGKRSAKRDPVLERLAGLPPAERGAHRLAYASEWITSWLTRLGTENGYRLETVDVTGYRQERIARQAAAPVVISMAEVAGTLTVTDPIAFVARVRTGFGPARAWGCGLMLTKRIGLT